MEIFERASRAKLRFTVGKGEASAEDLWDLSLETLNQVAIKVNKALKEEGEESFIGTKSKTQTQNQLRLDILKHVIAAKLQAKEAAATRAANQAKVSQLKELINKKAVSDLEAKSMDELQGLLGELTGKEEEETLSF